MRVEKQLRIALSMSLFTSKMSINPRKAYSPVVSKYVLLATHCSQDSSILLAKTRNKKVKGETDPCSINFCGYLLIISVHGAVAFGETLV